jgi:hypothetical protein
MREFVRGSVVVMPCDVAYRAAKKTLIDAAVGPAHANRGEI